MTLRMFSQGAFVSSSGKKSTSLSVVFKSPSCTAKPTAVEVNDLLRENSMWRLSLLQGSNELSNSTLPWRKIIIACMCRRFCFISSKKRTIPALLTRTSSGEQYSNMAIPRFLFLHYNTFFAHTQAQKPRVQKEQKEAKKYTEERFSGVFLVVTCDGLFRFAGAAKDVD